MKKNTQRLKHLTQLAEKMADSRWSSRLIEAYQEDTYFLTNDIIKREIESPKRILKSYSQENPYFKQFFQEKYNRTPLGEVAVVLPKNGLGLVLVKAIVSSYLAGNDTKVRIPRDLTHTWSVYKELLENSLENLSVVEQSTSSKGFLQKSFDDPKIKAVVVYGDDGWIQMYKPLVKKTGTMFMFEGPGNDPLVVNQDANIDSAVDAAINCGMTNGGQSCSALERFFIHSSLHDKFVETLVSCLKDMKTGSHLDKQTQVGPIKSSKVRQRILDQINSAINQGAELVIGGEEFGVNNPDSLGILPTVLTNCNPTMAVVKDETFGPVFPIIKFNNEEDLLSKVGQCEYGLNASAFGTCSPAVHDYLKKNHRNFYIDSTSVDASNSYTRFLDGGHLRSGLIWKRVNGDVVTIRGARLLYKELSQEI